MFFFSMCVVSYRLVKTELQTILVMCIMDFKTQTQTIIIKISIACIAYCIIFKRVFQPPQKFNCVHKWLVNVLLECSIHTHGIIIIKCMFCFIYPSSFNEGLRTEMFPVNWEITMKFYLRPSRSSVSWIEII